MYQRGDRKPLDKKLELKLLDEEVERLESQEASFNPPKQKFNQQPEFNEVSAKGAENFEEISLLKEIKRATI